MPASLRLLHNAVHSEPAEAAGSMGQQGTARSAAAMQQRRRQAVPCRQVQRRSKRNACRLRQLLCCMRLHSCTLPLVMQTSSLPAPVRHCAPHIHAPLGLGQGAGGRQHHHVAHAALLLLVVRHVLLGHTHALLQPGNSRAWGGAAAGERERGAAGGARAWGCSSSSAKLV